MSTLHLGPGLHLSLSPTSLALGKGVWLVLNGLLVNNQPLLVNNTAMKVTPNADA
jgi:hypothetical protein